jgi:type I restriction enzyme S subunit
MLSQSIENNMRRIAILEEVAQRISDEWFVRFRAPGREGWRAETTGQVPTGWDVLPLPEVTTITYGFPFKSKLFSVNPDGMPVIRIRDVLGSQTETFTTEAADPKYLVKNGDLLIGMDGIFHMCLWSGCEAYLNQRAARLRPKENHSLYWLFLVTRPAIKRLEETIVGTTVAHLSARDLNDMKVAVPPSSLRNVARKVLDPIAELIVNLKHQSANLRAQRDLLLPKLISGELDVRRVERVMEAAE